MTTFNEWYLSLEKCRQQVLRDDKWMLANAAFEAGQINKTNLQEAVEEVLEKELYGAYDCTRVWEAWYVGTMSQEDFVPVSNRIDEIADAIIAALVNKK